MIQKLPDGKYHCMECDYVSHSPARVGDHIEAKHMATNDVYTCPFCQKLLKNKMSLNNHVYRNHK